jgi:8-oxo-dGTP pyrophosphatase MutT (NUDIX family)
VVLTDQPKEDFDSIEKEFSEIHFLHEGDINLEDIKQSGKLIITGNSVDQLFAKYISNKIIIEAAGGMVINGKDQLLLMLRRGQWDMPKGKLDDGESIEQCALREVEEETGLATLLLEQKLQITYHTYKIGSQEVIKPSHWYLMKFTGTENPVPQTEEDITEIRWVNKEEATDLLALMFPSIREMVEKFYLNKA